jgi:uncharacterized protein YwqG
LGSIVFGFLMVGSMAILGWLFSRRAGAQAAQELSDRVASDVSVRRRNFTNLAPLEGENAAPIPQESKAMQAPSVAKKRSVAKKPETVTHAVVESISVVMRRQVPIRFDEEARSWIGGLPRMPVGTEWPRAKPKKPLHFVAQINCADLPPELWGGLGPREGWLLLFADIEALTDQIKRPFARVIHVAEPGPEAAPPSGLYWARNNLGDVSRLKGTLLGAQRRHFRQWPVDLISVAADTSALTGSEIYGAPENDRSLGAPESIAIDRPMTWRGAYTILAGLVKGHSAGGMMASSYFLLDYPEPYWSDYNEEWGERRKRIAEQLPGGYHCQEFTEAQAQLETQMYQERRKDWTQRSLKVLDEQLALDTGKLTGYRTKVAEARARGDEKWAKDNESWIEYFEKATDKHRENRVYLENLFAQYPSDEAFVAEIKRVGHAHLEWVERTQGRLRELFDQAAKMDLDASIAPGDWDEIAAKIDSMKSVYWEKTYDTQLLRKVERCVHYDVSNVVREEVLDRYVSPPLSADGLDADIVADLEPRLRNLETDRPHKLGGIIDSVYDDPLKKDHILLFQIASDAATGWILGDLGLLYVSIHRSDLEAGSFENVRAWLEA